MSTERAIDPIKTGNKMAVRTEETPELLDIFFIYLPLLDKGDN